MYFVLDQKNKYIMGKYQYLTGQPIFSQLLALLQPHAVRRLARRYQTDRYYKKFKTYDHLVMMLYAILHKCTSLREVTTGMQVCAFRVSHLGLQHCPRRSTISDANRRRSPKVFEAIYQQLYTRHRQYLPDSQSHPQWHSRLYIVDSTTISLFKEILKNVGPPVVNGRRKGGIKVHMLVKAEEDVPCFVRMTAAAAHDAPFIHRLRLPENAIVVFDRGYYTYRQYDLWTQQNVSWVTRLRTRARWQTIETYPIDSSQQHQGVISDQKVLLGNRANPKTQVQITARLVQFKDPQSGKTFHFITNHFSYSAVTIAEIYRRRWQIEILFKRLKQNYPLRYFLGDNENAIRIQIWCALIADLLLKIIRAALKKQWSFAGLSSMIRIHLMSYVPLFTFLNHPDRMLINLLPVQNKGPSLFD